MHVPRENGNIANGGATASHVNVGQKSMHRFTGRYLASRPDQSRGATNMNQISNQEPKNERRGERD